MITCERCGDFADDLIDVYGAIQVCEGCCEQLGGPGMGKWIRANPEPVLLGWTSVSWRSLHGCVGYVTLLLASCVILFFVLALVLVGIAAWPTLLVLAGVVGIGIGPWRLLLGRCGPTAHFSREEPGKIGLGYVPLIGGAEEEEGPDWVSADTVVDGKKHPSRKVVMRLGLQRKTDSGLRFLALQELLRIRHRSS